MTQKLFWQDPYLTECVSTVKAVYGSTILLTETIFYAFSGGQESDSGTIGGYPVLKAVKEGKEIFYTLEGEQLFSVGDTVKVVIDWARRYRLMRLHFAAEIVLELVCRKFPDIKKVGAHIAEDKARIDFECGNNISAFLPIVQQEAQAIIDSDEQIITAFSDEANERRYWKISAFSPVPCGGTHVRKTSELGTIKLKRSNPGKGKERIEIFVMD